MTIYTIPITPVSKPRMTKSDRWKKRACTEKYWTYKNGLRALFSAAQLPSNYHLIFVIPMPKSWSNRKRAEMAGKPHQSKPDKDNLEKGFLDALFDDDAAVWDGRVTKFWGYEGRIYVTEIEPITLENYGI